MENLNTENEIEERETETSNYYKNNDIFSNYFDEISYISKNISEDNEEKLMKLIEKEPSSSYFGGLFDGDGYIFMNIFNHNENAGMSLEDRQKSEINKGYTSGISLTQCRTNILQILLYYYNGFISKDKRTNRNTVQKHNEDGMLHKHCRRNIYVYCCRGIQKKFLVDTLKEGTIIKEQKIDILIELREFENRPGFIKEKENLYLRMRDMDYRLLTCNYHKINNEYIAGLFDAEGYCFYSMKKDGKFTKGVYMKITQKNHPQILYEIQRFLGFGIVDAYIYNVRNIDECFRFISVIEDYLIIKSNQVRIFKNYLQTSEYVKHHGYDNKIHNYRRYLYYLMNKEKHENEEYIYNKDESNISGFMLKVENEKNHIVEQKRLNKIEIYKKKSENMKGEKNHNFGKEKSDRQRILSSISNSIRRRESLPCYSDENILWTRELIKQKLKQSQIITLFKERGMEIKRDFISRIKNGDIKTTDELENDRDTILSNEITETTETTQTTELTELIETNDNSDSQSTISKKSDISIERTELDNTNFRLSKEKNNHCKNASLGKRKNISFVKRIEAILFKRDIKNKNSDRYKELSTWIISKKEPGKNKKQIGIPALTDFLNEKYPSNENEDNISIDIIKSMWVGKTKLFEEEFEHYQPEITYQEYLDIIQ